MADYTKRIKIKTEYDGAAARKAMRDVEREAEKVARKMQQLGQAVGRTLVNVGRSLTTYVTLPILGMGVASLKVSADFETGMNRVIAISGATGDQLVQLSEQAKDLGSTTQYTAKQAADAMGFLAMAGFEVNEILGAMPTTLQLAAAGTMDLAQAADVASNILTGYRMETEDLAHANDVLVKTFTSTNTNLIQLGEAMKFVAPIAAGSGIEFEETAAALGLLGNAGIQASMAGTTLRGVFAALLIPTKDEQAAMTALGVSAKDAAGNLIPLVDIIEQFERSGTTSAEVLTIFGLRAGPGMKSLIDQGSDALRTLIQELRTSQGVAQEIAEVQMQGLTGAMLRLKSATEGLLIAIGETGILESSTELVRNISGWIAGFKELDPVQQKAILGFFALAAAIGPVIGLIGQVTLGLVGLNVTLALNEMTMAVFLKTVVGARLALFALNPWTIAVAGGIGLITAANYLYNKSAAEAKEKTDALRKSLEDIQVTLEETVVDTGELNTVFDELKDASITNEEKFDLFKIKLQEIIDENPKFIEVLNGIEIHQGKLFDVTGDVIGSWEDLLSIWNGADSSNVVIQIGNVTRALEDLSKEEFMRSRSFVESVGRFIELGAGFVDPTFTEERGRLTIIERRIQEWEDIITEKLNALESPRDISGFFEPPSIFRGVFPTGEVEEEIEDEDEEDRRTRGGAGAAVTEPTDAEKKAEQRLNEWTGAVSDYRLAINLAKEQLERGLITQEELERDITMAMRTRIDRMMRLNVEQELTPENMRFMNAAIALYTFTLSEAEKAIAQSEFEKQVEAWRAVREANINYYEELRDMTWRMQGLFQPTDIDMNAVDMFYSLVEEAGREKAEAWWRGEYGDKPFPDAIEAIEEIASKFIDDLSRTLGRFIEDWGWKGGAPTKGDFMGMGQQLLSGPTQAWGGNLASYLGMGAGMGGPLGFGISAGIGYLANRLIGEDPLKIEQPLDIRIVEIESRLLSFFNFRGMESITYNPGFSDVFEGGLY